MDDHVFDRLTRVLGTSGSRRAALGALVAASPLAVMLEAAAKKRKADHKGHGKDKHKGGKDHKDRGKSHDNGKNPGKAKAQATDCWRSGACQLKKGANASQCNLQGYNPTSPPDCTGCNISKANLRGANLRNANLTKANLSGSCLIDADLTGAIVANNTNLANAVFCRTRMPDGTTINNSGCGKGTECCPACDATHPCPAGQLCCSGRCVTGNCCGEGDCDNHTCQTKACTNNTCTYSNEGDGGPGNGCAEPLQCCNGTCCPSGKKCCGGQCIDSNVCCTNNVPGTCPNDSPGCCGGECLTSFECCTNGQIRCPDGQTCVANGGVGANLCCPDAQVCGNSCIAAGACCNNGQAGCPLGLVCCSDTLTCEPCCGIGTLGCQNDDQCSIQSSGETCEGYPSAFPGDLICSIGRCCLTDGGFCTRDDECCSLDCDTISGCDGGG